MAKWYGDIGYAIEQETKPGVWKKVIESRTYYGDIIQAARKTESSEYLNDNINISNRFSIIADPFAMENFQYMRYLDFMGAKWKVVNVEMQYHRMILTVGGLYNGENQA